MNNRMRWIILSIGLAFLLAAGLIFRHFLFENVIMPIALILWAVLRVFMSVDQEVYWVALVFIAFVFGLRLLPVKVSELSHPAGREARQPAKRLEYWQSLIDKAKESSENQQALTKNLQDLLILVMAIEDQADPNTVREALQHRHLDVPQEIIAYLTTTKSGGTYLNKARRNWNGRLLPRGELSSNSSSGKQAGIEALLDFLESYAEIGYDEKYDSKN